MPRLPAFAVPFFKLSAANIASNLLVPLAGLIDTAFLGHLAEIRHLGGVAIATVIFNYIYWSFAFLRMGTTGLAAQAAGRQSAELEGESGLPTSSSSELWLLLLRNGMSALFLGGLVLLLQFPLRRFGFAILNPTDGIRASGVLFFNGRIWGAPAVLLNFVLLGWFLGRGKGRQVLLLSAISNGSNILLNYLMIVRWGWASFGAGLATALSQYAMLTAGMILVGSEIRRDRLGPMLHKLRQQLYDATAFRRLFALNRDILVRTFALVSAFSLFTSFSAALGTRTLAANTLLLQIVTLSAYFVDGLAFAAESYAGRFAAAGERQQLRTLLKLGMGCSIALGLSVALTFVLHPTAFRFLTYHPDILLEVQRFRFWLLPVLGLGAIAYLLDGYFLGLTAGPTLRNASLISTGIFFLPLAWMAQQQSEAHLLWLALSGLMAGRVLTLGWALHCRDS